MSDLVERLRTVAEYSSPGSICGEAAAEIERLREQLAHAEADYEVRNEHACSRWEEIQKLRSQLVSEKEESASYHRFWIEEREKVKALEKLLREATKLTQITLIDDLRKE